MANIKPFISRLAQLNENNQRIVLWVVEVLHETGFNFPQKKELEKKLLEYEKKELNRNGYGEKKE